MTTETANATADDVQAFPTALGWMAVRGRQGRLCGLAFGHASADEAASAVCRKVAGAVERRNWNDALVRRLQDFAAGAEVAFDDVEIVLPGEGFQRRVLELCRRIPYGGTMSYSELAAAAGSPGAARAVGNCMARNAVPLVVPCHRVVPRGGKLGRYSAPGGVETKRRLLAMEGAIETSQQNDQESPSTFGGEDRDARRREGEGEKRRECKR